jgi:sec-independent protein translocase protein TatA
MPMMGIGVLKLLLILLLVLMIFGAGKLPSVMGDLGKGLRNLRKGLQHGDDEPKEKSLKDNTDIENK